jgi:hypothetical protein
MLVHFLFGLLLYPRRRGYTVLPLSVLPSVPRYFSYIFNVYKNQQSQQAGSRNLMGSKTLPTIWGTYMKVVTKYQISAINSCIIPPPEGVYCFTSVRPSVRSKIFFVTFFSATIDGRNLIFGHKLHIGMKIQIRQEYRVYHLV